MEYEIDIDIDIDIDIGPRLPYPTAHFYGGFVEGAKLGFMCAEGGQR